jgi:glycosyltransferase involved in cell wall biosynthesis
MNKPVMLFDARAITCKPCGVRNVAENYLVEFKEKYDIVAIVNVDAAALISLSIRKEVCSRYLSRFNPLSDLWVSLLVLRYRPKVFFSAHSFLPVLALLPKVRVFVCHDLFSVFDENFFRKQGLLSPLARMFFRILTELSFLRASVVITPSEAIGQTFDRLFVKAKKVLVVHNGINLTEVQDLSQPPCKQVLFVGNFRSYKGIDILLDAWHKFSQSSQGAEWSLAVVTNEPLPVVKRLQQVQSELERVIFHSRISDEELAHFRKSSLIFVVPSRQEGFGIPLLEAIAAGGAVICSDIPVFQELLHDFNSTTINTFETGSGSDLCQVLFKVVGQIVSSDLQATLIKVNSENLYVLRKNYSWTAAADKVISGMQ